ncbi:hypothetical protein FisN_9Lh215 [Fistulifera solaris]|uniref:Fucosyltransferase n=1 Tax=Fistulifera solaris TaxID=1519565 RepID=A0A1Z5KL55_FISSO|nr:hypothetical protein FisN_9Lh215 [Fistulifera solaris]|eukprot:GAX26917.1 hypothetical protein FisN_9Lh215 [Fistulifera solaris]
MVSVKRPNPYSTPNKPKRSSFLTIRNVLIVLIVWQVVSFLLKSKGDSQNLRSSGGLQDALKDFEKKALQMESNVQASIQDEIQHLVHDDNKKPINIEKVPEHLPHEEIHRSDHIETEEKTEIIHYKEMGIPEPLKVEPVVQQIEVNVNANMEHSTTVLTKHGTGPTKVGFVADFEHDRQHAAFRQHPLPKKGRHIHKVAELLNEDVNSIHDCEYIEDRRWRQHKTCRDPDTELVVYNPAAFPKIFCGHQVKPLQAVKLPEHCHEPIHLSPDEKDPPIHGPGMHPVIIQTTFGTKVHEDVHKVKHCDIPCQIEGGAFKARELFIAGSDWRISRIWDDPYINPNARVERTDYRRDIFYSTTSFDSSIPLTFYDFAKYNLRESPILEFDKLSNKATYLLDAKCNASPIRRQKWFAAVDAVMETEAYGSCYHNKDLEEGETIETMEGRIKLYQKNRIALVFETGSEKDHITEMVWESLMSGSVPAILGASNLAKHLPRNSAIFASDFNSWDKFANYTKYVASDKNLWESYQAWKKDEKELAAFEDRYSFARTDENCRMCRWAYSKLYGLGWNHAKQEVTATHIERKLCVDAETKRVVHPFTEHWTDASPILDKNEECPGYGVASDAEIKLPGATIKRTVYHHDGVTDMVFHDIEGVDDDIVLRIEIAVKNPEGAFFRDTHTLVKGSHTPLVSSATIQDRYSKVTVLANWETTIISPKEGVVEIHFPSHKDDDADTELRRVRVVTEDLIELYDKLTEYYPSSFTKTMIQDFMDPLEMYYIGIEDK